MTNAATPGPAGITADDLYALAMVSDVQVSPDGSRAAYVVTRLDREQNDYRSAIWVAPTSGQAASPAARQFTAGLKKDTSPRWSPDGSLLAFVSNRAGDEEEGHKPQIFVVPADGGEARQLTTQKNGAGSPVWSPDGAFLLFNSATGGDKPDDEAETNKATKTDKPAKTRVITRADYRMDGTGYRDGKWSHLFVTSVAGGDARQVTDGEWDDSNATWSPDGRSIAFVSARMPDAEIGTHSDIYVVPAEGGEARPLTHDDGSWDYPAWSPDGKTLAILGHNDPPETGWTTHAHLWLLPVDRSESPRDLLAGWDYGAEDSILADLRGPAGGPQATWTPDGNALLFLGSVEGQSHLFRVDVESGESRQITGGYRAILGSSLSADGRILAYAASDPLTPPEAFVAAVDGSDERQISAVNAALLQQHRLSRPEEVWFNGNDGQRLHGWLMRPIDFQEGQSYPLILYIHGGPHAAYGATFFHEFQVLAARGYGLFYCNPRGSDSYGQQFKSCIRGNWGTVDYDDILAAAERAAAEPWVDATRMGVTGGSYGGYMTLWAIGHTDRFKAAASGRCCSNLLSFMGTSDRGASWDEEFKGRPGTSPEVLLRQSPITYVDQMRTPLLLEAQEQDYRCLIEQSEQVFMALRARKRETMFIRFPDESHGMSRSGKPSHRIERLNHIAAWFDRYLKSVESSATSSSEDREH